MLASSYVSVSRVVEVDSHGESRFGNVRHGLLVELHGLVCCAWLNNFLRRCTTNPQHLFGEVQGTTVLQAICWFDSVSTELV